MQGLLNSIKLNRKIQGRTQSQTAANPRHQEEEKMDRNQRAQNKQMQEKHIDQLSLFPKRGDHTPKQYWKNTRTNNKTTSKNLKATQN